MKADVLVFTMSLLLSAGASVPVDAQFISRQGFEDTHFWGAPPNTPDGDSVIWKVVDVEEWSVHDVRIQGKPGWTQAWFSDTISHSGENSFGAWLKDVIVAGGVKNRVEFQISDKDHHKQVLEQDRYYFVSMYIHPQTDNIKKDVKFFQAWQSHDTSSAKEPAFALTLKADGSSSNKHYWHVETSNKEIHDSKVKDEKNVIYDSPAPLNEGEWYDFMIRFKPSVANKGALEVWLNGVHQVGQTAERNFGYPVAETPKVNDWFEVRFGAYRGQYSETEPAGDVILMFDSAAILGF